MIPVRENSEVVVIYPDQSIIICQLPFGKRLQFPNWKMATQFADLPIQHGWIFHIDMLNNQRV